MSQITHGIFVGAPGGAGSSPLCILYGSGSPTNSVDPNVSAAAMGSLYIDRTTPGLWFKSSSTGWTQITIP